MSQPTPQKQVIPPQAAVLGLRLCVELAEPAPDIAKAVKLVQDGAWLGRDQGSEAVLHPPPLKRAAWLGSVALVEAILDKGGDIEIRAVDGGHTPLMVAAYEGWPEVVSCLVRRGADIFATDKHGVTPLAAAQQGAQETGQPRDAVIGILLAAEKAHAAREQEKERQLADAFDAAVIRMHVAQAPVPLMRVLRTRRPS